MIIRQTLAILLDAYRELNARKMFWISLGISALVVASFGAIGINERGITLLWWTLDGFPLSTFMNTSIISEGFFYKMMFSSIGIGVWLGWASTILALVSTASLIPDFASSGSIEAMLARPISRTRLFLTKYAASLLFVVLQAAVFTVASIVVIGGRSGEWLWSLLLAVPLVTLFFSYIYCVSALVGVWTRSTLAALLAGLALWGAVLVVGTAELGVLSWKLGTENEIPVLRTDVEARKLQVAKELEGGASQERLDVLRAEEKRRQGDLDRQVEKLPTINWWYRATYTAKTILPKTGETKEILERVVLNDEELERMREAAERNAGNNGGGPFGNRRVTRQIEKIKDGRTVWWIVGTSLGFEAVILAIACWVFNRRDF